MKLLLFFFYDFLHTGSVFFHVPLVTPQKKTRLYPRYFLASAHEFTPSVNKLLSFVDKCTEIYQIKIYLFEVYYFNMGIVELLYELESYG